MNHLRDIARRPCLRPSHCRPAPHPRELRPRPGQPGVQGTAGPHPPPHPQLADPSDVSVVNPNVDTPYSYAWLDLREGPVLLTMPPHTADRYMSAQLVDLYGYIVGYVSPRTNGNAGGTYLVHGPSSPATEDVVDGTFDCPTDLCLVLVRTQLFDDADLPAVWALQDAVVITPARPGGTTTGPTSHGRCARTPRRGLPAVTRLDAPAHAHPAGGHPGARGAGIHRLRGRRSRVAAGQPRRPRPGSRRADLGHAGRATTVCGVRSSAELFGSRDFFAGDDAAKAAGAYLGILGNAAEEYLGVGYRGDEQGQPFDGRPPLPDPLRLRRASSRRGLLVDHGVRRLPAPLRERDQPLRAREPAATHPAPRPPMTGSRCTWATSARVHTWSPTGCPALTGPSA